MVEITNMGLTGTSKGRDLLEKREGGIEDEKAVQQSELV